MIHFKDNKNKSALSTRWAQMTKQEQIIEKKKMEIQAKLEAQKQAAALAAQAKLTNPTVSDDKNSPNIFSNDGSFMSQYKALLEKQSKEKQENEAKALQETEVKDIQKSNDENDKESESSLTQECPEEEEQHQHQISNERRHERSQRDRPRRWNDRSRNRPHSPLTPVIEDRKKVTDTSNIPPLMQLSVRPPDDDSMSPNSYNNPWGSRDEPSPNEEYEIENEQDDSIDNQCPDSMGSMSSGPGGPDQMGYRPMGPGSIGPGPLIPNSMGLCPMGPRSMGTGPMGPGPMIPGPMRPGPMGPGPMGPGPMGPGPMGPGPMGPGLNMPPGPNSGPMMGPGGSNMPPMPPFMGGPPNFPMPPNFMRPNGPSCGPGPMPPNMCGPNMRGPGPNGPMPFFPPFNNSPMSKGPPNSMMPPNSMRMPNFGPHPPFGPNGPNFGPDNNGPPMRPPNMRFRPPNSIPPSELDNIPPPDPMKLQNVPPPMPFNQVPKPNEMDAGNMQSTHQMQVLSADPIPPSVRRVAADVAANGDHWENVLKAIQDPNMWFLHNTNSIEYKQYRDLVMKLRKDGAKPEIKPEDKYEPEFSLEDDDSNDAKPNQDNSDSYLSSIYGGIVKREQTSSQSDDETDVKKERRKRKKSRWGNDPPVDVKPEFVPLPNMPVPLPNMPMPGGKMPKIEEESLKLTNVNRNNQALMQYAMTNYGTTNLSAEDWQKCEDNFKLNLLYQDMLKKRQEVERLAAAGKHRYEYDSDEDTADGTWEHKLRAKEMNATERWATELTKQAQGKHHIGDFLPPEELKKFMEKYTAIKGGKEPDLSDYKEYKLKEDNVGFKMLQKLGWNEGQGLGAEGTGIVEPINKANQPVANLGLGASTSDVVSPEDDEFDAYRKRMMLAYRFRPNPLNNPRRPYY